MPLLSSLASSFWSFCGTSMLRDGRPMLRVCAKTILHKNGFLESLQAVEDPVVAPTAGVSRFHKFTQRRRQSAKDTSRPWPFWFGLGSHPSKFRCCIGVGILRVFRDSPDAIHPRLQFFGRIEVVGASPHIDVFGEPL